MALSFFSSSNRIGNIVITDQSIRYIEIKLSNQPIPYKWKERILPTGIIRDGKILDYNSLSIILEECVSDWKIKNRKVRFIVPDSFINIRKISIPKDVKTDEIGGYLYLELGSTIHLPFDEPVFDFYVLGEDVEKKDLLIFASQEENVLDYSDLLTGAGLKPISADISPLSLYRLYYYLNNPEDEECLLMVQFDLSGANICIFENHVPFFMHHTSIEYDSTLWEANVNRSGQVEMTYLADSSMLNFQFEDIYKEINRLMDFYRYSVHQGKKQVTKIVVNGDHPFLPEIISEMNNRYDVAIEPLRELPASLGKGSLLPRSFYLALGLALKEV
jgi:type IV pilus assembly protein PilM